MRIETSAIPRTAQMEPVKNQTSSHEPVSGEDQLELSAAYQKFSSYASSPGQNPEDNPRVAALLERLKQDKSFTEDKYRSFLKHPLAKELAKEIILADDDLQEQIAKKMWEDYKAVPANARLYDPPTWKEINVKGMLLSSDESTAYQALLGYESLLLKKARTFGLTETEQFLDARLEQRHLGAMGTFPEKMEPVLDAIEAEFEQAGMHFDHSKSYSFSLDTTSFRFSVSGGTEEENTLIEQVVNTSNYHTDHFLTTLAALYSHRHEDGKHNPWTAEKLMYKDSVPVYGITSVEVDYAKKMKQLFPAYDYCRMDRNLKAKYGFGIEDLTVKNGSVAGKTAEVTQKIEEAGIDFMKNKGFAYLSLTKKYTGTPEFEGPVFTFENGTFRTTYQVFEDPSQEGATNPAELLSKIQAELDAEAASKESILASGRGKALKRTDLPRNQEKIDALLTQLTSDRSFVIGNGKRFYNYPLGRALAQELILSNREVQAELSERMKRRLATLGAGLSSQLWPTSEEGFEIDAILSGDGGDALDEVFLNYDLLLNRKAQTIGLTKAEQVLMGVASRRGRQH